MDNQNFLEKKYNENLLRAFIIVVIILLVHLIFLVGFKIHNVIKETEYIGKDIEAANTIFVSGEGEVYAKPDLAIIDFSVKNEAETVTKAMAENTQKINSVIEAMKKEGIQEKDLKTTDFNIYPRYEWYEEEKEEIYPLPEGKRVLVGYEVTQSLQVKIRDMEKIGDIIQTGTENGANQVGNLQLTIEKPEEFKNQARTIAIEKAKTKAKEITSQLGVELIRITNFSESGTVPQPIYFGMKEMAEEATASPTVEIGENLIRVEVTLTYKIR
ncbi:MAG: hypothetical protein COZ88_01235 [Candidatus Nealsonbacteria bacterium CG_4_8_14_3_um_filter_34_13]|nr:MAG: hypothetical protein COZ88_01235 [Candidatus Nealsonbacteria bacterium CG_4_8_14_3_um_filter_34_13]